VSDHSATAGAIPESGTITDARASMGYRIWDAWRDMRQSTRRLIEENPSEHRLLFYVLLSDMIFFLSWSLKTVIAPVSGVRDQVPVEIGFWLIGALLLRTASMYLFSLVVWLGARAAGGRGSWRDTRAGVFWGALVAAPFGFLMAFVTVTMSWLEPYHPMLGEDWIALPPYWISLVPFLWFISQGVAEANRFEKNAGMFLIMSGIALVAMILFMALNFSGAHV